MTVFRFQRNLVQESGRLVSFFGGWIKDKKNLRWSECFHNWKGSSFRKNPRLVLRSANWVCCVGASGSLKHRQGNNRALLCFGDPWNMVEALVLNMAITPIHLPNLGSNQRIQPQLHPPLGPPRKDDFFRSPEYSPWYTQDSRSPFTFMRVRPGLRRVLSWRMLQGPLGYVSGRFKPLVSTLLHIKHNTFEYTEAIT